VTERERLNGGRDRRHRLVGTDDPVQALGDPVAAFPATSS
jgi:hypothetical protein